MSFFESANSFLSGAVLPVVLISVGIYFAVRLKFFYIIHPARTLKRLRGSGGDGTSPFKAMTMALAGTLGVGNISGVATAITAGGAGAVFWMWASALAAMSVKYAEVALAVKFRRCEVTPRGTVYHGGAYLYIREGLSPKIGKNPAAFLGALFGAMLIVNSLLTGNIVQVNAAASVFDKVPHVAVGIVMACAVAPLAPGGAARVGRVTAWAIPILTVLYTGLSLFIIFTNAEKIGGVFAEIFRGAFSFHAAAGGVAGYGISRAVRFGVARGIFSNEAGCGTAPTAHASANAKSPHDQGCLGIFEVFCDTIIMCTMTALVILIARVPAVDGIPLSMKSYGAFCGAFGEVAIGLSVIIFAAATVICQEFYGIETLSALGLSKFKAPYLIISFAATILGSVISPGTVWQFADFEIAAMTIINSLALFALSDEVFGS